jgi:hypothetical protein
LGISPPLSRTYLHHSTVPGAACYFRHFTAVSVRTVVSLVYVAEVGLHALTLAAILVRAFGVRGVTSCPRCVRPVSLRQMAPWRLPGGGPKRGMNDASSRVDEGVRLLALEQRLLQGVDLVRRTCASGAVDGAGLVDRPGNDGS